MTDETPPGITTSSNPDDSGNLNPESTTPWESNPGEDPEPEFTLTMPDEETITEVKLVNPENVDSYTVVVTDENGDSETVRLFCVNKC